MHNGSCLLPFFLHELHPIALLLPSHGREEEGVMFLFHASTSLCLLLLLTQFVFFLLLKLFHCLHHHQATSKDNDGLKAARHHVDITHTDVASGSGGGLLFWYNESAIKNSLLGDEGKDSWEGPYLEVEDTFVAESTYTSSLEDLADEVLGINKTDAPPTTDTPTPSDYSPPILSTHPIAVVEEKVTKEEEEEEPHDNGEEKNVLECDSCPLNSKKEKLQLQDGLEDKEICRSSLFGESTSKSSIEWRSSTITKDSETEYLLSSSSRRSSSNWESYTLFRKYDEEMLYFHRISTQKLTETESIRSIKHQPRSISERIVHKLTVKHKSPPLGVKDPYQELESAYVAQICLAWEALSWNYNNFHRRVAEKGKGMSFCPARVAQEFQQFQVLLQRFIENEPYEYGRRPEVFARKRISSPKLLLVPEFREDDEDKDHVVSATVFLIILEDVNQTFMKFLKADKQSHYELCKALFRKRTSSVDPTLVNFLKKVNKKKKMRIKDIVRGRRCLKKRRQKEGQEQMEVLMGLIDLKVASRVLRMSDVSEQQLHWCEEKMTKVRIWEGKVKRDSSPLFFPVH